MLARLTLSDQGATVETVLNDQHLAALGDLVPMLSKSLQDIVKQRGCDHPKTLDMTALGDLVRTLQCLDCRTTFTRPLEEVVA